MEETNYQLQLTGYVGEQNFNARQVRAALEKHKGSPVNVMIDSLGGSLAEGLSICGAFRDHGDVTVHFRGMNASAATIASMGAKEIHIAPEALYLVHKCSMGFFDWASRNADELETFIKALQETKEDLDTIDKSIASLYASRCKRKCQDMLSMMQRGRWLSAQEALDLGFVDKIIESKCGKEKKKECSSITKTQASVLLAEGLPLPPVPVSDGADSMFSKIIAFIESIINKAMNESNSSTVNQTEAPATAATAQAAHVQINQAPDNQAPAQSESSTSDSQASSELENLRNEKAALEAKVKSLEDRLAKTPAAAHAPVVSAAASKDAYLSRESQYLKTTASAKKLFDSIP